jgi:NADH dehydrogenase
MGSHVAKLISAELGDSDHSPRKLFRYRDKGSMSTIGRNRAVAYVGGREFGGFIAWLLWGVVHIIPLIGFRNKMSVIFSWLWSYFSLSKNARLITGRPKMKVKQVRGVVEKEQEERGER